jgi:hypothetical protein
VSLTRLTALPVHPLLAAAYPVVFLFAQNIEEQMTVSPLWLPLGSSVLVAALGLFVLQWLLGNWVRAAFVTTLGVALFFSFGHAWILVGELLVARRWLVLIYAVTCIAGLLLILRSHDRARHLTRFLNLALLVAILVNGAAIVAPALSGGTADARPGAGETPLGVEIERPAGADQPDIYYLVFDRYAARPTLDEVYGHDNASFIDALRAGGFEVADGAWSNYFKTAFSVYSSLQMEFIDRGELGVEIDGGFGAVHNALGQRLTVPATLRSIGYEFIMIPSWWEPGSQNVDASRVFRYREGSEFASTLLQTTVLSLLSSAETTPTASAAIPDPDLARAHTRYQFEQIRASADRPGPKFVFAHLLVPHPPYVFGRDGSLPDPVVPEASAEEPAAYIDQLEWTNGQILDVVARLTSVPVGDRPVIILQADEGPYPATYASDQRAYEWLDAPSLDVQQKFGILNAIYIPGRDPKAYGWHEATTPVNTFRILFNALFDAGLPLLPDVSYHSPNYDRLYDFQVARDSTPDSRRVGGP